MYPIPVVIGPYETYIFLGIISLWFSDNISEMEMYFSVTIGKTNQS